ncbi:MAG: cation:dicarboxylase symporter family transporter, partial [Opitutaceae bacterium]
MSASAEPVPSRKWYQFSLTQQIMLGLVLGVLLGWWMSQMPADRRANWETWSTLIRDIFLHLIKAMIAPLVFASIVQGIAGTGDLKKVGRMGAKALLYFEVVTTFALVVGLFMVNWLKPGAGVILSGSVGSLGAAAQAK